VVVSGMSEKGKKNEEAAEEQFVKKNHGAIIN